MTNVVVCPTPQGGHIEHALGLASACSDFFDQESLILTRPGAAEYLGGSVNDRVTVAEVFTGAFSRPVKKGSSTIRLLSENLIAFRYLHANRHRIERVIIEEPRFILLAFLRHLLPPLSLFVHNAANHNELNGDVWTKIQNAFQRYMARRMACLVHGTEQREIVSANGARHCLTTGLPGDGPFETYQATKARPPAELANAPAKFLLCIGELRHNKGIHLAMAAASEYETPLVVAGKPVDLEYRKVLAERLPDPNIVFIERFLDGEEFEWLLSHASGVVLPYLTFEAQSGPLARAMRFEKPIIANGLPALREQARGYENAKFIDAEIPESLGRAMGEVISGGAHIPENQVRSQDKAGWERVAFTINQAFSGDK